MATLMSEPVVPEAALSSLPTEMPNPRTIDIDLMPTEQIVALINAEDHLVAPAVGRALPQITQAVDLVVTALERGGRLHYFGAGTSARVAVMDAAELPPTYGVGPDCVVVHQAGGPAAASAAIEGAEDDYEQGRSEASAALVPADVAVGIAASGRTPYVAGALTEAATLGVPTVLITANPEAGLSSKCDVTVTVETGPEVVAGSTRMKAGTAQKLVLNCISTAAMIKLGRTFSNLMVTMQPTNAKLMERARRILSLATGVDVDQGRRQLAAADGSLVLALVMTKLNTTAADAGELLRSARGSVRKALTIHAERIARRAAPTNPSTHPNTRK